MSNFLIKNYGSTSVSISDSYIDVTLAAGETINLEDIYIGELWRLTFSAQSGMPNGGALYTAINNSDVVRRDQTDTNDVAIANAFDDAIWLWHLTRQEKEACRGTVGTPSDTNRYVTDEDTRLTDARYPTPHAPSHLPTSGSDPLSVGTAVSISTANGAGNADSFSRSDHLHQGVHGIKVGSESLMYGDVTIVAGTDITITENSSTKTVTFDVAASITTELAVSAGSGLNALYNTGKIVIDGTVYILPAGSVLLADDATNYVYVDIDGSIQSNTTGYPSNVTPLAEVTTASGVITVVTDNRSFINQNLVWGDSGEIDTIQPDDLASTGSIDKYARIDHQHAIVADVPLFLGSGGVGVVTTEGSSTSFARADHNHVILSVSSFAGLPGSPSNGQQVWASYGVYNGLFYYDGSRSKWLSMDLQMKNWNSGTNSNVTTVNLINSTDDTQNDNDVPNPHNITIVGLLGTQANALTSGNSTTFDVGVFDLATGAVTQGVTSVTLSTVGDRGIRNMSLNVNVSEMTILSTRRIKASGTANITRPALSVWYRVRLA